MELRRLVLAAAVIAIATAPLAAAASASAAPAPPPLVIATTNSGASSEDGEDDYEVTNLGGWTGFNKHGTLKRGLKALGPAPKYKQAEWTCRVTWKAIGARVDLTTLGYLPPAQRKCNANYGGQVATFHVTGTRWQTDRGLKIGATVAQLEMLYPDAERSGTSYAIATKYSHIGDGGRYSSLDAVITGTKVTAFSASIGGQGD